MAIREGANQDSAARYEGSGSTGNAGSAPNVSADFSGSAPGGLNEKIGQFLNQGVATAREMIANGSGGGASYDASAAQAELAAQQEAARKAADIAKQRLNDKKIAEEARKAQAEKRPAPPAPPAAPMNGKNAVGKNAGNQAVQAKVEPVNSAGQANMIAENTSTGKQSSSDNELRGNSPAASQAQTSTNNGRRKWKSKPNQPAREQQQQQGKSNKNQRQQGSKAQQGNSDAKNAPNVPTPPPAPAPVTVVEQLTDRQLVDNQFRDFSKDRIKQARRYNKQNKEFYNDWRNENPDADSTEFFNENPIDAEGFEYTPVPLMRSKYRSLEEYENPEADEETGEIIEKQRPGRDVKDTRRQDRLIDETVNDIKLGFFHLTSEKVMEDEETGEKYIQWSLPVEDAMSNLMEYFGLHGIDGQRTVFRLVRLYASMAVDRNGKMFNEGKNEWTMTEREFCDICNLIERSCIEYGHPMGFYRYKLRGTDVYPSGVIPKVVANAITGPNSNLNMTADELVRACQDNWLQRTYPIMKANLTGDKISQRIAIEDMQQAIARVDGITAADFSRRYGVDTTLHYKLSEYADQLAEYAAATNGKYDSKAVSEEDERTLAEYRKEADVRSGRLKQKGILHKRYIEVAGREVETFPEAGLNLVTSLAKINSVIFRPVIAVAMIPEKGLGNLSTKIAIASIRSRRKDGGVYEVSDEALDRMKTEDAVMALDAAKMLFEVGGPGAARLFAQENKPMTHDNVVAFLRDKYMKNPSHSASKVMMMSEKLNKLSQKMLVGDIVFRKSDTLNWLNALVAANSAEARAQNNGAMEWRNNSGSLALTGDEIEDIMLAHTDVTMFFTEMMGTDAGISAYNMMRGNNIAQINPLSYRVDRFLRDHGVTNAVITLFVDTFPTYGLNYIYNIWPFSRTQSYLFAKAKQHGGSLTEGDLVIGGNVSGFYEGLRMNLIYDAVTLGRNSLIGGVMALAFLALGFEPPDDENNIGNVSMWKIGGQEVQWAWWLNDLTQLGLPNAYFLAAGIKTGDWQLAGQLYVDSLHDQIDGNVLLDCVDLLANWRDELIEFDQMVNDPSYMGPKDRFSFALSGLYSNLLRAGNKLTPGQPLMDSWYRSALVRGADERTKDPSKVYKRSDDPELDKWYMEHGVTERVENYNEYLERKYSTGNLLYGWFFDTFRNTGDDKKTGYQWWEMPNKTFSNPVSLVWSGEFNVDYNNMGDCTSREQYDEEMANKVIDYIQRFQEEGLSPQEAADKYGFIIPHDARKIATNYMYDVMLQTLDNDWKARNESGELADENVYQAARVDYYNQRDKLNTIIYSWLKSDTIPEWGDDFEQLITDYDVSYRYKDSGKPCMMGWLFDRFDPNVEAVYIPKGNHPTSLLPLTLVDYSDNIIDRGYNAETSLGGFDPQAFSQLVDSDGNRFVDREISVGRNRGQTVGEVIFGGQPDGSYTNFDNPTTGWRADVPKEKHVSDDIKSIGKEYEENFDNQKVENNWGNYPTYFPKSSYGWGKTGGGSYNYNPKIYSNPRQVNADRAATMYTKTPQTARTTYLRPGFSTKGSREAYKRQDI